MIVLGFSGKAGAGKNVCGSYAALRLYSRYNIPAKVMGFADALKSMAKENFGWDGQKNEAGRFLLQKIGQSFRAKQEDYWVGVVDSFIGSLRASQYQAVIITDVRYKNEAEWLRSLQDMTLEGTEYPRAMRGQRLHSTALWRVTMSGYAGLSGDAGQHASETDLDNWDFDGQIEAAKGDLQSLYDITITQVDRFMEKHHALAYSSPSGS